MSKYDDPCPCPGWARIPCWLDATLNARWNHLAWLYRWHMRYVRREFDRLMASGRLQPTVGPTSWHCDHMSVSGVREATCWHGCEMKPGAITTVGHGRPIVYTWNC